MRLILLSTLLFLIGGVRAQRRVVGDISESRISQVAGEAGEYDYREKNRYRRPATYLILASKIVRPSTIYQVCCIITSWVLLINWWNISGCRVFVTRGRAHESASRPQQGWCGGLWWDLMRLKLRSLLLIHKQFRKLCQHAAHGDQTHPFTGTKKILR